MTFFILLFIDDAAKTLLVVVITHMIDLKMKVTLDRGVGHAF